MKRVRSVLKRSRTQFALLALLGLGALGALGVTVHSVLLVYLLYAAISLVLGAVAASTLVWMLNAWRTPDALSESHLENLDLEPTHFFSLIVPARHEEAVLDRTLDRLVSSDYPNFEILVVVGDDDDSTRGVAESVASRFPRFVKVVVDSSWPKNKPKALNAALPHCTGTVIGVFDAEDDVHPGLLRRVDQCFGQTNSDVVQAGVQLMNFRSSWLTVHNVLEYYFWFRSRLHRHARQRFIPLGGNTVFVRTAVLRAVGGWDEECLAEDCELGVRLSAFGAQTSVFYEPELVTREECPPTLRAFVKQRTRWNQGYLQTLGRGYWLRLPWRQRVLGGYILLTPYLMALAWLMIPAAIVTAILFRAPVPVAILTFVPLVPMLCMFVVDIVGLGEFCRLYDERPLIRDYSRLLAGLIFYQGVLTFSAARAVFREARGTRGWEKTEHLGLHLAPFETADRHPIRTMAVQPVRIDTAFNELVDIDLRLAAFAGSQPTQAGTRSEGGLDHSDVGALASSTTVRELEPIEGCDDAMSTGAVAMATAHLDWLIERYDDGGGDSNRTPLWVRLASTDGSIPHPFSPPDSGDSERDEARGNLPNRAWVAMRHLIESHVDIAVQIPLLVLVGLVQSTNVFNWPGTLFDEGTYVANAWAVGNRGTLGFYTFTYGHPPLAWLLIALWSAIVGLFGHASYSIDASRALMCIVAVVSSSLVYTLGRRLRLAPPFAACAVLLFALSPLSLYFHRAVLLDNPATAWALAAFVLAASPTRRLWSFIGSGACFAAAALSKETTLILLPALLFAVWQNTDARTRRYCVALFLSFFALLACSYPIYAALKGELIPGKGHVSLLGSDITQLFGRQGTGSVFASKSIAHATLHFWLSLDPWLLGASLVFLPVAVALRRARPVVLAFVIQVVMVLRPGYLPAMYVVAILPFGALIVAFGAEQLWRFVVRAPNGRRLSAHATKGSASRLRRGVALRPMAMIVASCALAATVAGASYVVPRWSHADAAAMTLNLNQPVVQAEAWIVRHIGHQQRLIVHDDMWVYLIEHGFNAHQEPGGLNSSTVVSYWPLDRDPAVRRFFPFSWREFNYIISNAGMRDTPVNSTPSTAQALAHSQLVIGFGRGASRIEIRRITPTGMAVPGVANASSYTVRDVRQWPPLNLYGAAHTLGVSVDNIVRATNGHAVAASWWYYEAKHHFGDPLPRGTVLYYKSR